MSCKEEEGHGRKGKDRSAIILARRSQWSPVVASVAHPPRLGYLFLGTFANDTTTIYVVAQQ